MRFQACFRGRRVRLALRRAFERLREWEQGDEWGNDDTAGEEDFDVDAFLGADLVQSVLSALDEPKPLTQRPPLAPSSRPSSPLRLVAPAAATRSTSGTLPSLGLPSSREDTQSQWEVVSVRTNPSTPASP